MTTIPAVKKPTAKEKQKFLKYVEKKRLNSKKKSSMTVNKNSKVNITKGSSSNLFITVIDDFFEKIDALKQFQEYSQEQKENFKGNILNEILETVINGLIQDAEEIDTLTKGQLDFLSLYTENQNYDELFFKIDTLVSSVPAIADRFLTHLVMKYISLCKEFYVLPSEAIIPFVKEIDRNYS